MKFYATEIELTQLSVCSLSFSQAVQDEPFPLAVIISRMINVYLLYQRFRLHVFVLESGQDPNYIAM